MEPRQNRDQLEEVAARRNRWSSILLIVFVIQTAGYGYYTYRNFSAQASPENLKKIAEKNIRENYGKVRKAIQTELIKEAPSLADKLSKRAVASLPEARKRLEKLLEDYFDKALEKGSRYSVEKFRQFVRANKEKVRERYKDIEKLPEASTEYILHLEKTLDHHLGTDIRKQADRLLASHKTFNDHLDYLLYVYALDPKKLEPTDLLELRMLRTARTIQLREVGKLEIPSLPLDQ